MGQLCSQLQARYCQSRRTNHHGSMLEDCSLTLVSTEHIRNDEAMAGKAVVDRKAQFLNLLMALLNSYQFQSLISFSIESDEYHGVGKTDDAFVVVDCSEEQNRVILGNLVNHEMIVYEGTDWNMETADRCGIVCIGQKRWEGGLRENQPFGYGILYDESGRREYAGFVYKQRRMGYGIDFFPSTQTVHYDGCFFYNQRHGYGILNNRNGKRVYEGLWREGRMGSPTTDKHIIDSPQREVQIVSGSFRIVSALQLMFWLHSLRRLIIGNDCFVQTRVFVVDGLSNLQQIVIGERSFSVAMTERTDGVCRIIQCPRLKTILFGEGAFTDYSAFELENLPSLQSLRLGGCCFLWTPRFVLASILR